MAIKINGTTVIDNSLNVTGATITGTSFAGVFATGTACLFGTTTAPTGWTKSTTHNDKALRVVSGAASSGGSVEFSTVHASKSISGSVGDTTITTSTMPGHTHDIVYSIYNAALIIQCHPSWGDGGYYGWVDDVGDSGNDARAARLVANGGNAAHGHGFTGTSIDFSVSYIDLIIATKN